VRNPFFRRHPFGEEELSSYLDRRLSPTESARLEEHLASCEPCRQRLEGLRAVVEGLRALPSTPAPRSFALRPEQVEARRRMPIGPVAWAQRASVFGPAGAAAAALLVFIVLVGVDLATLGGGHAPRGAVPAPSAREAFESGQALGAAPAPTPASAPAARAPTGEQKETGTPEPTVEAPTPTEPPATVAPPATGGGGGEGGGAGRWVLRGFQGAAGAAFLAAMAALVWQRRRGRGVGRT
jgi:anti-sigma factor RsiW